MTTITIDRAVVQQALNALDAHSWEQVDAARSALRAALAQEQAEPVQEPHRDLRAALQTPGCERLREWVEIGPVQRAALETFVETFALAQPSPPGCDHCRHPLYAATRCRVCGRVTEPKGGGNLPPPLREPAVAKSATTQQQLADTPPSDYRRGYWDGFAIGKREGRIEAEDAAKQAEPVAWMEIDDHLRERLRPGQLLYTAPPQRKPLTDDEIRDLWSWSMTAEAERTATTQQHAFARAIERAHGIGDNT